MIKTIHATKTSAAAPCVTVANNAFVPFHIHDIILNSYPHITTCRLTFLGDKSLPIKLLKKSLIFLITVSTSLK